jgi:hypothetical protein
MPPAPPCARARKNNVVSDGNIGQANESLVWPSPRDFIDDDPSLAKGLTSSA